MSSNEKIIRLEYSFKLDSGEEKRFQFEFNEETMDLRPVPREDLPSWTNLGYKKCRNCPLDPASHKHCPVAASLVDVVESFARSTSYEEADITVRWRDRKYFKRTSLQYGVSSLMGLHMVTSGCPILNRLRPMAYTHLPFASVQETLYRVLSMYLLAQYFVGKEGGEPDWELSNLQSIFEEIGVVNKAFYQRLLEVTRTSDAVNNALVNLDCFAILTTLPVATHTAEIQNMFAAWIGSPRPDRPPGEQG